MLSAASTFRALQGALKAWELVQVELHGSYSLQRLCDFYFHSSQIGWHRVLFWCVWTPIPCLAFNIAMDIAPLADPSAGRDANYMFWIRCVFVVLPIAYGIFMQIGYLTPNLDMTRRDALATSIVLTSVCVPYAYAMAGYISMPTPFLFLMAAPPFMCSTVAMFGVLFGKKLMRDLELRWSLFRAIVAVNSQVMLNLVYLAYIYGFNSIPESYQSSYLVLITVIKIAAKNAMSKLVGHMDDLKPEIITFNIDVFHALHVSLAMQRATTISTSVVVMIIDSAQACVSIYDVYIAFQFLKGLIDSIPHEHPLHGKNFLEVAMALHQGRSPNITQSTAFEKRRTCYTHPCAKGSNTYPRLGQIKPNTISVVPVDITGVTVSRVLPIPKLSTHDTFSNHSEAYLHAARRLLFMVEFIMLTEYAEVVIPVFYSASSCHREPRRISR